MVKPIPIHHTAQVLDLPQEFDKPQEIDQAQTQQAVPKPVETIKNGPLSSNSAPNSIEKTLEQLNEKMRPWATGMQFELDPDLERLVVSIIDKDSGEVLRTIPSETLLQVAKMITSFQGHGIDTSA
ncbi:MAG TPA: flagellar protein FlaG [Paenalcaligenes sp.]|nr:flagellar protein FlaG [Paenalcaligenes sp.]